MVELEVVCDCFDEDFDDVVCVVEFYFEDGVDCFV